MPSFKITASEAGLRLDQALALRKRQRSRSYWAKLIKSGLVGVNGQPAPARASLHIGDVVSYKIPKMSTLKHDVGIIYEDQSVIVLNKPSGMLTHSKGAINEEFTLADFLRPLVSDADSNRPGVVHRLDRDTSGVIIAAKNKVAKAFLQRQFSRRSVEKTYRAITRGVINEDDFIIDMPIRRNPKQPSRFMVDKRGRPALTHVEVTERFTDATLVALKPQTGRTHQLRIHLANLGHPIIGDRFYGNSDADTANGLMLHAYSLALTLPDGERKIFIAPLPKRFKTLLRKLKEERHA